MKEKIIATCSIAFMLFATSAVLFDRLLIAYAITLIYAVMRWKISEQQGLIVKGDAVKWVTKIFIIICCVIFAAGGGFFSSVFEKTNPILQGLFSVLGFSFAYDIGRFFKKITVGAKNVAVE